MKYTLIMFGCLFYSCILYSRSADECHVYIVDVEAAQKVFEKYEKTGSMDPRELEKSTKVLGTFAPKIGEEELTTKHFPMPGSKAIVTASVFYTDESMALQKKGEELINDSSIILGVVVSEKKAENAIAAENNAEAESTYNRDTIGIRVKTNVRIAGRRYLAGLECHCNESHPPKDE